MAKDVYILGIDPGNEGACALLTFDGTELDWFKLPTKKDVKGRRIDQKALVDMLECHDILTAYIENPVSARTNGKLMTNYGLCLGALDMLEIIPVQLPPRAWMSSLKKELDLRELKNINKEFTLAAFKKAFPGIELPELKPGVPDDNVADASLLAYLCQINIEKASDLC